MEHFENRQPQNVTVNRCNSMQFPVDCVFLDQLVRFLAVFKVDAFRPLAEFKREVAEFARYLKETPLSEGSTGVFYPGEVEHLREQERRNSGIEIEDATWKKLRTLASELKLADVDFD